MAGSDNQYFKVVRWIGFIASLVSVLLGLIHIIKIGAKLRWPSGSPISDVQMQEWRNPLFSFRPDIFMDAWTPLVMGIIGVFCHLKEFPSLQKSLASNFLRFGIYHFVTALWGNFGYNGGMGIMSASFSLLATVLSLIAFPLNTEVPAALDLSVDFSVRSNR